MGEETAVYIYLSFFLLKINQSGAGMTASM